MERWFGLCIGIYVFFLNRINDNIHWNTHESRVHSLIMTSNLTILSFLLVELGFVVSLIKYLSDLFCHCSKW